MRARATLLHNRHLMHALLALALAAAPPHFDVNLSLSIRGERVGAVHLRFDGEKFRYESLSVVRRGKALSTVAFGANTDALGRGRTDEGRALRGPLPSTLGLWMFADGDRGRCIDVEDERDGHAGKLCATRTGNALSGEMLGEPFRAELADDGGPRWLEFPGQRTRFDRVEGPLPLPAPNDLFGHPIRAGRLAPLDASDAAHVSGRADGCDVDVELRRAAPERDELLASTASTDWTDDARDLQLGTRKRWATARALAKFVDQAITSVPTSVADEDARGVWRVRRGSCVGQARVFHALANALGLPSRIVFGALVEDGQLAPHAWDEVEVDGHWFGVDPSRGLAPVGPEHLPLAREGDPDPLRAGRCLLALPTMRWTVEPR